MFLLINFILTSSTVPPQGDFFDLRWALYTREADRRLFYELIG